MKNFSDLLDTNLKLNVIVNGVERLANLHDTFTFLADNEVSIDGINVLPSYWHLSENGILTIDEPFYRWYHRVSGQGWLLEPQ